jgi:hypothetical protein
MVSAVYRGPYGNIFYLIHKQTGVFSGRFPHPLRGAQQNKRTAFLVLDFYNHRSIHAITLGDLVYWLNI